jgi:hypothetical protein
MELFRSSHNTPPLALRTSLSQHSTLFHSTTQHGQHHTARTANHSNTALYSAGTASINTETAPHSTGTASRSILHCTLSSLGRYPRLFKSLGLQDVELTCVPIPLRGWAELESIVPITYFTQLAANNGTQTHVMLKYLTLCYVIVCTQTLTRPPTNELTHNLTRLNT